MLKPYQHIFCTAVLLFAGQAAFAANSKVAYLAYEDFWQVWLMQADGSNAKQITNSSYDKNRLSWYPDGKHLLVNGSQGEIIKLNVETGEEQALALNGQEIMDAIISPNGKTIAYSIGTAGTVDGNDIWLYDIKTKNKRKLITKPKLQHQPVWTADGKALYFLSTTDSTAHDIWKVDIKAGKQQKLTAGQGYHLDLTVSRQGTLAWSGNITGDYEIWVHAKKQPRKRLTEHTGLDGKPSWSPDEQSLLYESINKGVSNIWHLTLADSKTSQITQHKNGARSPVWFQGLTN